LTLRKEERVEMEEFLEKENEKMEQRNDQECKDYDFDLVNLIFKELDQQVKTTNSLGGNMDFSEISQAISEAHYFHFDKRVINLWLNLQDSFSQYEK